MAVSRVTLLVDCIIPLNCLVIERSIELAKDTVETSAFIGVLRIVPAAENAPVKLRHCSFAALPPAINTLLMLCETALPIVDEPVITERSALVAVARSVLAALTAPVINLVVLFATVPTKTIEDAMFIVTLPPMYSAMIATALEKALEIALPIERVIDPAPEIADAIGLLVALTTVPTPPYSPALVVDVSFVTNDEPLTADVSVVATERKSDTVPE